MTVTSGATQPTDRHGEFNEMLGCSSPHVIEFFTEREQMNAGSNSTADLSGYGQELEQIHRNHSGPFCDPLEDWLYSLVAGAGLVSLLIGILCMTSFPDTEKRDIKPARDSDSSFATQNPG
jgi:hypothetical protein